MVPDDLLSLASGAESDARAYDTPAVRTPAVRKGTSFSSLEGRRMPT